MNLDEKSRLMVDFQEYLDIVLKQKASFFVSTKINSLEEFLKQFSEEVERTSLSNKTKDVLTKLYKIKTTEISNSFVIPERINILALSFKKYDFSKKTSLF